MTVRTRFAPSPTGTPESIHLGFVIRALWNYALAKKAGGQFILRLEDTDKARSREDTEKEIYKVLKLFKIIWDEGPEVGGPYGPYRQSERLEKYREAGEKLVNNGYAYYDFDSEKRNLKDIKAKYTSGASDKGYIERPQARNMDLALAQKRIENGEPYVIRAKIPDDKIFVFEDWIRKRKVEFKGSEVTDLVLLKSDGYPTYHLAVVVDDLDMKITHVFRGPEWISTTPVHLFLYEGLGKSVPIIGHFSVILDPRTNKKFSKRDETAMFGVNTWLDKGYLPEALLNYLMLLGWAPKDNREIFSLEEFVELFDQTGVQKANPIFDEKKLTWMNSQYMMNKSINVWTELVDSYYQGRFDKDEILRLAPLIQTRIKTLGEFADFAAFFFEKPEVDVSLLGEKYKDHLESARRVISNLTEFNLESLNEALMAEVKEKTYKTGDFFMDMRIAITGKKFTPPINESMIVLGKDETLSRLKSVVDL